MHIWLVFLTALLFAITSAAPIPSATFQEIEKRWHQGETEAQIHANIDIRAASPAWPIARNIDGNAEFAHAFDSRTLRSRMSDREASSVYGAVRRVLNQDPYEAADRRWNEDEVQRPKLKFVVRRDQRWQDQS